MKSSVWLSICLVIATAGMALAQSAAHSESAVVTKAQIDRALETAAPSGLADTVLRVLPIGQEYNVGVSVVRRTRVNGKTQPDALQHHEVTEVYQVVSGSGTLVTGGRVEGAKEITNENIVKAIGPSAAGQAITNGKSQHIGAGDVVVIPANVPHGFSELAPEGISYVLIRIDPHRVLQPK